MINTKLINGAAISEKILEEITEEIIQLNNPIIKIVFIQIGEDPASTTYLKQKQKIAKKLSIKSQIDFFSKKATEKELIERINELNYNSSIHGILIQSPLPAAMLESRIFNSVSSDKDIDGFSAKNLGLLCQEDSFGFTPCTPAGIIEIFKRSLIKTEGKHIVIIGRSIIVGKPMLLLMLKRMFPGNATITICHSKTINLKKITKTADIIITAIGKANIIRGFMVKTGAVIIDVGINRILDKTNKLGYRLVGDVNYEEALPIVSKITPVPGGVGPMTVAMLMKNTIKAYKRQIKINKC